MPLRSLSEAYTVLEVHTSATESEVKSAYKRLALSTHPDKNLHDPQATVKFQQVTEAYQMIMGRLKGSSTEQGGSFGSFRFSRKAGSDSEEFDEEGDEFDANVFSDADLARALFNFIFAGREGASAFTFMRSSATCDCADCVEERNLQRRREQYRAEQAARKSAPQATSSPPGKPVASPVRPPGFDPHAHWLSDDEDQQKRARSSSQKSSSKKQIKKKKGKQKVKKSPAGKKQTEPAAGSSSSEGEDSASECPQSASTDLEDPVTSRSQDTLDEKYAAPPIPPVTPAATPRAANNPHTAKAPATPVRAPATPSTRVPPSTQSTPRSDGGTRSAQTTPSTATTQSARTPSSTGTLSSTPGTGRSSASSPNTGSGGNVSSAAKGSAHVKPSLPADSPRQSPQFPRSTATASKPSSLQGVNMKPTTGAYAASGTASATTMPRLEGVQLCRTFLTKHGNCRYGDSCRFSHGSAPGAPAASSSSEGERDSDGPGDYMQATVPPLPSPVSSTTNKGQQRARQAPTSAAAVIASVRASQRATPSSEPSTAQQKVPAQKKAAAAPQKSVAADKEQQRVCDFYGTVRGCRYGEKCKFAHVDA